MSKTEIVYFEDLEELQISDGNDEVTFMPVDKSQLNAFEKLMKIEAKRKSFFDEK